MAKDEMGEIAEKSIHLLKKTGLLKQGYLVLMLGVNKRNLVIGLLIKFKGEKSLLDLAGLKIELEEALKKMLIL